MNELRFRSLGYEGVGTKQPQYFGHYLYKGHMTRVRDEKVNCIVSSEGSEVVLKMGKTCVKSVLPEERIIACGEY